MKVDYNVKYDGIKVIDQGVDSGNAPNTIGRRRLAWAQNVSLRGGFPYTRPGWIKHTLTYESAGTQANFIGLWQGAGVFNPGPDLHALMPCISGRLFQVDIDNGFLVKDVSIPGELLLPNVERVWFEQAEEWFVTQDGNSAAMIYDGSNSRWRTLGKEVPTGTVMSYSNGRLWVAVNEGRGFVGSDLVGSSSGTPGRAYRDAVLKFTQNAATFSVPSNSGGIQAMKAFANLDTSLGQGPLIVFCERGAFSVQVPYDPLQWASVTYPIQTVAMLGDGARSQESTVSVNGDIWFRAGDGIRSFQLSRRDWGTWANTPMSFEMDRILIDDATSMLDRGSGMLHDNRLLMTVTPQKVTGRGIIWKGIVALDFTTVSGINSTEPPNYDGLWTGLDVLSLLSIDNRGFMFAYNSTTDEFELWEMTKDGDDMWYDDEDVPIECVIETCRMDFETQGWDLYKLLRGSIWVEEVRGTVLFDFKYKPDAYPGWVNWAAWSENALATMCLTPGVCTVPVPYQPQFRPYMLLPMPEETCDPKTNRSLRMGYEFQTRIQWTGPAMITKFMIAAELTQKEVAAPCRTNAPTDTTGITLCESPYTYHA